MMVEKNGDSKPACCGWTKSCTNLKPWETIASVFTGESSFHGFLGGAGLRPSTVLSQPETKPGGETQGWRVGAKTRLLALHFRDLHVARGIRASNSRHPPKSRWNCPTRAMGLAKKNKHVSASFQKMNRSKKTNFTTHDPTTVRR